MNPFYKNLALWMVIGLVVVLLFNVFGSFSEKTTFEPNYSDFLKNVDAGLVQSVTIRGNLVTGKQPDPPAVHILDGQQLVGCTSKTHFVRCWDSVPEIAGAGRRASFKWP